MSDILCITDRTLCREDFLPRLEQIAAARPAGIVLQEKDLSPVNYKALAAQVLSLCRRYDVPCILHTFVDIARELGAGAIHLPCRCCGSSPQRTRPPFKPSGPPATR